jgi:hypothetical protein
VSTSKLIFRRESHPGFSKNSPEAPCATFTLHAVGAETAVARFAVHVKKSYETQPYMEHTVRVTLVDGRLVATISNPGTGSVMKPPTSAAMDRDGTADVSVMINHTTMGCPSSTAACASNGALWFSGIARGSADKPDAKLVVEPGQKDVDCYTYCLLRWRVRSRPSVPGPSALCAALTRRRLHRAYRQSTAPRCQGDW